MSEWTVEKRWQAAVDLAAQFPEFVDFAEVCGLKWIPGFRGLSAVQRSICHYLQHGERMRMVRAQRGEGKTFLTAFYCIWRWVHNPGLDILLVSAGQDTASDIMFFIINMVREWDILEYMRPGDSDRDSSAKFDLHRSLKGLNKQPSIVSVPVLGTLPGRRPGMIIADDIESNKNSMTATSRETLIARSREFIRMCTHGDIIYLGTPQNKDSVYNTLPLRGVGVRTWPGRYPALREDGTDPYGEFLAPELREAMEKDPSLRTGGGLLGNMGKPTDPERFDEADLQAKELDNGPEDFTLHYLLDTSLSDEVRLQLKVRDLMVADCAADYIPAGYVWFADPKNLYQLPNDFSVQGVKLYSGQVIEGHAFIRPDVVWCAIDPASEGGDELAMVAACTAGNTVHILDILGIQGGLSEGNTPKILGFLRSNKVTHIRVESNMGHGLFELGLRNMLKGTDLDHLADSITGEYAKGQKERRIISVLRPVLERHRLAIHPKAVQHDIDCCRVYGVGSRHHYSLFYQMANITTDRESLPKDDRIDALAMVVNILANAVLDDPQAEADAREARKVKDWLDNPLGLPGWTNSAPQHNPLTYLD